MKIKFSTQDFTFLADFNTGTVAKAIIDKLPVKSKVSIQEDLILLHIGLKLNIGIGLSIVRPGQVAYFPQSSSLGIYLGATAKQLPNRVGLLGNTACSLSELAALKNGENIEISCPISDNGGVKVDPKDNRILSQGEIDSVVDRLLALKQKNS